MTKDEIRKKMKVLRNGITEEYRKKASFEITQKLISLPEFENSLNICTFISSFKEPYTNLFIDECKRQNKNIFAPVTDINKKSIYLYKFTDNLIIGEYGIKEPEKKERTDPENIDFFVVPGLAFDRSGSRIGFGMGYYDKILKKSSSFKVGICYSFQYLDIIPHEKHDITMDIVVCENN